MSKTLSLGIIEIKPSTSQGYEFTLTMKLGKSDAAEFIRMSKGGYVEVEVL